MLAMFSLGLMSLVWMVLFTLIVSIENLLAQGEVFARLVGAIMMTWGITLILGS
jgi:predicted metal-binding membrane protein|tara:strand:- start:135 stop:296 length:162 start_codon:yes stop_codon:yes gene_type:complete